MNWNLLLTILQTAAAVIPVLVQTTPFISQAIAAFSTGGWAGLVTYLESLITNPPAGVDKQKLIDLLENIRHTLQLHGEKV